ncbi:hypothetical protein K1719_021998 [Acacia pycnantha]|nr:hypothetical protein K1719_021998 [Acacia pycnantha]
MTSPKRRRRRRSNRFITKESIFSPKIPGFFKKEKKRKKARTVFSIPWHSGFKNNERGRRRRALCVVLGSYTETAEAEGSHNP